MRPSFGLLAALVAAAGCTSNDVFPISETPKYEVAPAVLTLVAGDSGTFVITSPGLRGRVRIRVVSSQPSVAAVDSTASLASPIRVRAGTPGTAVLVITGTVNNGSTVSMSLPVTVNARPTIPPAMLITPRAPTIQIGDTVRINVAFIRNVATNAQIATFRSTDTTVVTVDSTGLVRGRGVGVTTVRVSSREAPTIVDVAVVTVRPRDASTR